MTPSRALTCSACAKTFAPLAIASCDECWAPLEPVYDWPAVRTSLDREPLAARPPGLWRYRDLLPVEAPSDGHDDAVGTTPLLRASRLGGELGIADLFVKYEAACHPTLSFKDRLVAVALAKARELGMTTVACASTGNLAMALAAGAAAAGLRSVILVPDGIEAAKLAATAAYGAILVHVRGNYDRASLLASRIADRGQWGVVNANLRAYYAEGGKTVGYEIAEQLGWRLPGHVVCPIAGGSLLTRIDKAFGELRRLGLVDDAEARIHGVQPAGCNPVVAAWRAQATEPRPVKPDTIVHSLAVGDPPDGARALAVIRRTGGRADDPTDLESVEALRHLARTEGLLAETAGGTVVAAARRLAAGGAFTDGRPVVLVITGHGLKTTDTLEADVPRAVTIDGTLEAFDAFWRERG